MTALTIERSVLQQVLGPACLYLALCVLVAAVFGFGSFWMVLLFAAGAAVALLSWRLTRWPDTWTRYLSFGAVLLLMCVFNRAFYMADYFVNGLRFDQWPFFARAPEAALLKGEIIAITGTLLAVLGWRWAGGMRISPALVMEQPRRSYRIMQVIYAAALIGNFLASRFPGLAVATGQMLPVLMTLGLVATFVIPMVRFRRDGIRLLWVFVLGIPFIWLASDSGMKQNAILSLIPSAVMTWRFVRHPLLRSTMVVAGVMALALIASYVNFYRNEVWIPQSRGLAGSDTVAQDFLREIGKKGAWEVSGSGLAAFIKRSDASYAHGWAISLADQDGFQPRLVFEPLTYVFIPRLLWPDKPAIRQGWEYSGLVFGQRYISWSSSSTAAGLYPGMYLGFGWLAVLFGSLLAGGLLAWATRVAARLGGPLTAGLYIFAMFPFMLRMNATWTVGALAGPIVNALYVVVIVAAARAVVSVTSNARRPTQVLPH